MKKVLVPMADGSEEMEAVIIIDCLRRAELDVTSASIHAPTVTASRQVRLLADSDWASINPDHYDAIVLPGGNGGTEALMQHDGVLSALRRFCAQDKWIAAVCAAPRVLQAAGVLAGKCVTSHPAARQSITEAETSNARVVVDGRMITSQGPGTSFEFALTLISALCGREKAEEVAAGLVLDPATKLVHVTA